MRNRLFIDIHALQIVPPSCINRDDSGSPKTANYGGVTRARVSSQAWKKAMRDAFRLRLNESEEIGIRTKRIVGQIAAEIESLGGQKPDKMAIEVLDKAGIKVKPTKKNDAIMETGALFFISPAQIHALAKLAIDGVKDKKIIQQAMNENPSLDIALFGRMVADDPNLNTDACAQVAHSISTHKVRNEQDFYTALDERGDEDHAGAGMMGTVEFNSAVLYRYTTVAVHDLKSKLGDETGKAVREFIHAFLTSMPTGKQNTFANRTLPNAVLVTLRKDQPINLVGAFEKPVPTSDNGYLKESCRALVSHANKVYEDWLGEPELSLFIGDGLEGLGQKVNFQELLEIVGSETDKYEF